MLKCKIHRMDCFDQPFIEKHTYQWGKEYHLSILNNPHIISTLFYSRERWVCLIRYISPSERTDEPLKLLPLQPSNINDIYQQFSHLDTEGILIELVNGNGGSALRVIATSEGSTPIYFSFDKATINLSWDFKEIALAKKALTLDFEYLVKSTFEPTYTSRTAFQGVSMLTAGSSIIFSDTGRVYKYPNFSPPAEVLPIDINLDEAKEEFMALLRKKMSHQLEGSKKIALELSGGLDSSTVALGVSDTFSGATINTYGIIISDSLIVESQKQRRNQIINFTNSHDYNIKIEDYLPCLASSAHERYYLNSEAYADAFEHIWSRAANEGHWSILNGCGGDELFPQFTNEDFSSDRLRSIDDKSWQSYNRLLTDRLSARAQDVLGSHFLSCAPTTTVDAGVMLAMARRAPLLLILNLFPLYPLRDSEIINFCSQLPIQHRINKTLFEHLLSTRLKNNSFSNYPKETFMHADETSLLRQKSSYIIKCDNFKVVDIGLIDSKTLKQDLELINRQTPRYVFDYLLNILAIERFLEAYL